MHKNIFPSLRSLQYFLLQWPDVTFPGTLRRVASPLQYINNIKVTILEVQHSLRQLENDACVILHARREILQSWGVGAVFRNRKKKKTRKWSEEEEDIIRSGAAEWPKGVAEGGR